MNIAQALSELDLRPGATEQEIRGAYRTLVAKWHPDKHQNDPIRLREAELRIKNINRAFEALQKADFRTENSSGKGGQKTENPKGSSRSKSPEPPEVPKDGRSKKKAQKRSDEDSMKHGRKSGQLPVILIGAAVLFTAGILAGRLFDQGNPPPIPDVICSKQKEEIAKLKKTNNQLSNEKTVWEKAKDELESEKNALKLQVLDMRGPEYVLSQVEALKFSREQLLTLLQTCLAKDSPSEMPDLLFEALPQGDPLLLRQVTKKFWEGISEADREWIRVNFGIAQPSPREKPIAPKNEVELQQEINEIILAKEDTWLPLYLKMLKARVRSCNDAGDRLSELLALENVRRNNEWSQMIIDRRKVLEQEKEDSVRVMDLNRKRGRESFTADTESQFGDCLYWDWVDLDTPNRIDVRSLYKSDIIFKKIGGQNKLEHWPKSLLTKNHRTIELKDLRRQDDKQWDLNYRVLYRTAISPELVVIEVDYVSPDHGEGIWLWSKESGLLFPLGKIPYVGRMIPNAEAGNLGLQTNPGIGLLGDDEIRKITSLTEKEAAELAKISRPHLWLVNLNRVGEKATRKLVDFEGSLSLDRLSRIGKAEAKELSRCKGALNLNGLTSIDKDVARELAQLKNGDLYLCGLTSIDKDVAEELIKFNGNGTVHLQGLIKVGDGVSIQMLKNAGFVIPANIKFPKQ
jgi:curved DNA-binding protein CbpA